MFFFYKKIIMFSSVHLHIIVPLHAAHFGSYNKVSYDKWHGTYKYCDNTQYNKSSSSLFHHHCLAFMISQLKVGLDGWSLPSTTDDLVSCVPIFPRCSYPLSKTLSTFCWIFLLAVWLQFLLPSLHSTNCLLPFLCVQTISVFFASL